MIVHACMRMVNSVYFSIIWYAQTFSIPASNVCTSFLDFSIICWCYAERIRYSHTCRHGFPSHVAKHLFPLLLLWFLVFKQWLLHFFQHLQCVATSSGYCYSHMSTLCMYATCVTNINQNFTIYLWGKFAMSLRSVSQLCFEWLPSFPQSATN